MAATRKRKLSSSAVAGPSNGPPGVDSDYHSDSSFFGHFVEADVSDIVQIWQHGVVVADVAGDPAYPHRQPDSSSFLQASNSTSLSHQCARTSFLPHALKIRHSTFQYHLTASQFRRRRSFGGHTSCVNALAFSRQQERYLASGGDSCEIHINDMFTDLDNPAKRVPLTILKGHQSNIFSLSWSANNQWLFSTGNDSQILYYDVEHSNLPIRGSLPESPSIRSPDSANSLGGHDDSVPEISSHPTNPFLLLSCDDGGNLKLVDIRLLHDSVAAARSDAIAGFSSVQWNPNQADGNTFAAATCGRITGSLHLYDVRQCFASDPNRPLTSKDAVLSYHTALMQNSSTRGLIAAAAETNSICFDPTGRFLASSISRYHPTIYAVNDADPLVTLESTVAPDVVEPAYYDFAGLPHGTPTAPKRLCSSCTIKHGSFGLEPQTGKLHYAIGSDDFRAYVFEIPPVDQLIRQREFVSRSDWLQETAQLHSQRKGNASQTASKRPGKQSPRQESHAQEPDQSTGEDEPVDQDDESDSDMDAEALIDRESEVAYCAGSILRANNIVRPARITKQAYVLCGGRSIINTALIHPTLPFILTAGITSDVTIHSAALFHSKDLPRLSPWDEDSSTSQDGGGTRPRFLVQRFSKSLISDDLTSDSGSEGEEDEDEDEQHQDSDVDQGDAHVQEEGSDVSDDTGYVSDEREQLVVENSAAYSAERLRPHHPEADSTGSQSSRDLQGRENAAPQEMNGAEEEEIVAREEEPQSTVQDFLSAMRNDPLYTSPAPLDFHHDRHIGTYALSHLSPGLVSTDISASSSSSDHEPDENSQTTVSQGNTEDDGANFDFDGEHDDDDAWSHNAYTDDGYNSWMSESDHQSRLYRDIDNDPVDEQFSTVDWGMLRAVGNSDREQKRMRLFDELLRRDETRHLTAGFRKVPASAGGRGEQSGFTCGGCQGSLDTDA